MNPCPCGYYGDSLKPCTYAPAMVTKYTELGHKLRFCPTDSAGDESQKRISGPLLDCIDIDVEVPRVDYEKLSSNRTSETSDSIRARVQAARDTQNKRFTNGKVTDIVCNADMRIGEIRKFYL